jgi:hypothetical protein
MEHPPFRFNISWSEWCYENDPFLINECLSWSDTFIGIAYESLLMVFVSLWILNRRRLKKAKRRARESLSSWEENDII